MGEPCYIAVKVTAQDIKRGKTLRAQACPLYLAIKRHFLKQKIWTYWRYLLVLVKNHFDPMKREYVRVAFPAKVSQFVQDFDTGKKVKPFSFDLMLVDH